MTAEMVAPAWMHTQVSAEQYGSWSSPVEGPVQDGTDAVITPPTPCSSQPRSRSVRGRVGRGWAWRSRGDGIYMTMIKIDTV